MKKKLSLYSSILAITLCAAMIVGATFALFTSTSSINIAVNAANVDITATIDPASLETYSMNVAQNPGDFQLGGEAKFATVDGEPTLMLDQIAPGDKAIFNIVMTNESSIDVLYRVTWAVKGELYGALEATADSSDIVNNTSAWVLWSKPANDAAKVKEVPVSIELPYDTTNQYQGKSAEITFTVEAIQANATVDANTLQAAIDKKTPVITLESHVYLTETLVIPADYTGTLNLNGYNIYLVTASTYSLRRTASAAIVNLGSLTLVGDGSIFGTIQNNGAMTLGETTVEGTITNEGEMTIEGATVTGTIQNNGEMTVETATVTGTIENNGEMTVETATVSGTIENNSVLTINGGAFTSEDAVIENNGSATINGGTFESTTGAAVSGNTSGVIVTDNNKVEFKEEEKSDVGSAVAPTGAIEIADVAALKEFAANVNAGNNYAGKTVVLTANIDLKNEEWAPIGTESKPFKGTFDGLGHTISNLVVNGDDESYQGLFGYTTDGAIKNLTVKNAKVSGYLGIGVVAGSPYTSSYSNISVIGHVEVNGFAYVGGVAGRNAYGNFTNIVVSVDDSSYVKAISVNAAGTAYRTYVGGVIGFAGEGNHTFSNITSNIDVIGSTIDVGGIIGIAHYGNNFVNVTCTGDVKVTNAAEAADAEEMGGIAGVWHNQNGYKVTFTNCKFTGTLTANVEADLSDNTITGAAYSATGTGELIIDGGLAVFSLDALDAAIKAGKTSLYIAAPGNYYLPDSCQGKTLTISGTKDVVIGVADDGSYEGCDYSLDGATVTFNGLTIVTDGGTYRGYARMTGTYNNCTFINAYTLYMASVFNNCEFNVSGDAYNVWTWGAPTVEFNNCVFNSSGKSVLLYGNTDTVLTANNCVFNDDDAYENVNNKAAIEVGSDWGADKKTVIVNNVTVNGFDITNKGTYTGTTLFGDKNSLIEKHRLTVIKDGATLAYTANQLVDALETGKKNVVMMNDIKIEPAKLSNAYGKTGINVRDGQILDGNGKTLNIKGAGGTWDSGICITSGTIKNITVTGSFRGIFIKKGNDPVILENVTTIGTTYTISCDEASKQGLIATNCSFSGWTSFAGTLGSATFTNCYFGAGNGYNFSRPYASTTYIGCTFAEGHKMDPRAAVTFENCTIAGAPLTAENLSTLVTSNLGNASVK